MESVNEYGRGEESTRIVFITASRKVQDLEVIRERAAASTVSSGHDTYMAA